MGRLLPGDGRGRYRPGGYKIGEVGPVGWEGRGVAEMRDGANNLKTRRTGGCPFQRIKGE